MKSNKKKCTGTNTRFHYTDTRTLKIDYYIITMYVIMNYNIINKDYWDIQNGKDIQINTKIYDTMIKILEMEKNTFPINIQRLFEQSKISKQYQNIKDEHIKYILDKFIFEDNEYYNNIVAVTPTDINDIIDEYRHGNFVPLINFSNDWWYFNIAIFDAYTMFRVFRSYKNGTDAKNIIIYAGNLHVQNYAAILNALNFDLVFESENQISNLIDKKEPFQCVDITYMKLPLFS